MRYLFEMQLERNRANNDFDDRNEGQPVPAAEFGAGGLSILPDPAKKPKPLFGKNKK